MHIRAETPADIAAIFDVNLRAFGQPAEARLVDALRREAEPFLSLVAEDQGTIVGHIAFSPATITRPDDTTVAVLGLAPMAVVPERQNQGIGSQLVRAGLEAARQQGYTIVIVLGHPEYYPRFGFRPARSLGITSEYDVPDDVFLVLGAQMEGVRGVARYHEAFANV